jgi:hypothetical protein
MNNAALVENNEGGCFFIIRYRFQDSQISMYSFLEVTMVTEDHDGTVQTITCQEDLDIADRNDQKVFWSLYGIDRDHAYECIGDFVGRDWAMGVAVKLGGVRC